MKTDVEVVDELHELYRATFGGKSRGRFKISREDLKRLSGRTNLHYDFVTNVIHEGVSTDRTPRLQIIEFDGGRFFGVIEESKLQGWRTVPVKIIKD